MRNIPELYKPGLSFWDTFPQFTLIEPLATFHKNDKSRLKCKSSEIMWAIALIWHPDSDIYYVSDKVEQVSKNMLGDAEFNWNKYQEDIDKFLDASLNQAKKSKIEWENRLRNRDAFLKEQEYSFDHYILNEYGDNALSKSGNFIMEKGTAEQLDRMAAATSKLYDQYFDVEKKLDEEEKKAKRKGGKIQSLSDSKQI